MTEEGSEPLNPLYTALTHEPSTLGRRRANLVHDPSSPASASPTANTEDAVRRSHTLGRHTKLNSSENTVRRNPDIPRSVSSVGVQLSGSLPTVTGHEASGNKVPSLNNAPQELPETERFRASGSGLATVAQVSEVAKPVAPPHHLMRQRSNAQHSVSNLPRANCLEKIVICLDISTEMDKKSFVFKQGDKTSPMELTKKALNSFLHIKRTFNPRHEFALVLLDNTARWVKPVHVHLEDSVSDVLAVCDFTSDLIRIITYLDGMKNFLETDHCDLSSVFQEVANHVQLPDVRSIETIPPFNVRVILIYGRSKCTPHLTPTKAQKLLQASTVFCFDALYLHETPSCDNLCEDIFKTLCSLDANGNSYILAASKNPTKIFDCVAQLLGHPLQRPLQHNANYVIASS